jgi:starch-binding outer membrane protein, SusD/RagB family
MKQATYIILIALFAGLGSCKKFLDVKPEDSVLEDDLYSKELGFQTSLNGVYMGLTGSTLYGGSMTMEMLEILAQRYNCLGTNPTNKYNALASYDYGNNKVWPKLANTWFNLYEAIANLNTMLVKMEEHRDVFTGINYELIKGEALALRAFLHFDAFRMFGAVYKNDSIVSKRIPYYTAKTTTPGELLTGKELIEKVMADLKEAEAILLTVDPIISKGRGGVGPTLFTTGRHLRMNYYAVKLLQARVYLYANRKAEALAAAKVVIEKQPTWFPFVTSGEVTTPKNPDRIFSNELVFTLQNFSVGTSYMDYFVPNLADSGILAPVQTKLEKVYENSTADYRYLSYTWAIPTDGTKSFKCFYKYAPPSDTALRQFNIPLMRVTEAYLIAAEASTVTADKFQYLNTVRAARNLGTPVAPTANFTTELTKEYQKEFYGEGQLFFYYKRNNTTAIENGSVSGNITMNADKYVLPLPDIEMSSRN